MSPQPIEEPAVSAGASARQAFLHQQALQLVQTTRALKVNLFMAEENDELSSELKKYLYKELAMCAAIVEDK